MTRFGTLAQLEFDHPDLGLTRRLGEQVRVEMAVRRTAAEIAGRYLPDDVTAALAMIFADRTFAGILGEIAHAGAVIQRQDGVHADGAETHAGDVEDGGIIGLRAGRAPDGDAEVRALNVRRHDRMRHPAVADGIDIIDRAKRPQVGDVLGALIDDGALVARKGQGVALILHEILPDLRTDIFEDKAEMPHERIVAQDRMARLDQVPDTQGGQGRKHDEGPIKIAIDPQAQSGHDKAEKDDDLEDEETRHGPTPVYRGDSTFDARCNGHDN